MSDKTLALVTGGAQGIGYACADALAQDGHRIILADVNADGVQEAAEKLGDGAIGMTCDMGDPSGVLYNSTRTEVSEPVLAKISVD